MHRTPFRSVFLAVMLTVGSAFGGPVLVFTDPASAGPDYAIQGEYEGQLGDQQVGVQIIALGGGKFESIGFKGGLPGGGWEPDGDREQHKGSGTIVDGVLSLKAGEFSATVSGGQMHVSMNGEPIGNLKRIERKSSTLGAAPPAGAIVLFDGKGTEKWKEARMEGPLLVQGATSTESFKDFTLHLEFRTPFKPEARGQERGNSGFYAQGRYEVQILDSFGLSGENNECGGIYTIKKPDLNMCFPPLQWQTYDIDFKAASFDADGKKTTPATMTVKHNGVLIHKDVVLDHATTAAPLPEGPNPGPVYLQDHGNPVRYRNVWILAK